jgi:hypothetical protein
VNCSDRMAGSKGTSLNDSKHGLTSTIEEQLDVCQRDVDSSRCATTTSGRSLERLRASRRQSALPVA